MDQSIKQILVSNEEELNDYNINDNRTFFQIFKIKPYFKLSNIPKQKDNLI